MDTFKISTSPKLKKILIDNSIKLHGLAGMLKLRQQNGQLLLDVDDSFGRLDGTSTDKVALLSFLLNSPITLLEKLTYNGNYIPTNLQYHSYLGNVESFDASLFMKIDTTINDLHHSQNSRHRKKGRIFNELLAIYQRALRLYQDGYIQDAYFNLIRILDGHSTHLEERKRNRPPGDVSFIQKNIQLLPMAYMKRVYSEISIAEVYRDYHQKYASQLYAKKLGAMFQQMSASQRTRIKNSEAAQFFSAVLYCLFTYRHKYAHNAFPFPRKIEDMPTDHEHLRYFFPTLGELDVIQHEPLQTEDIHARLNASFETNRRKRDFPNYYNLLPSFFFLNSIVRVMLTKKIL